MYSTLGFYYATKISLQTSLNVFDRGVVQRYEQWERMMVRWTQIHDVGLFRLNLFLLRHRLKVLKEPRYLLEDELEQAKAIWNMVAELNTEINVMGMFVKNYADVKGYLGDLKSEVTQMRKLHAMIYHVQQYTFELRKTALDISRFVNKRIGHSSEAFRLP